MPVPMRMWCMPSKRSPIARPPIPRQQQQTTVHSGVHSPLLSSQSPSCQKAPSHSQVHTPPCRQRPCQKAPTCQSSPGRTSKSDGSNAPIGTKTSTPPPHSTPPCPSDILRCHAKQKTATASRISCPDTPNHNTPSSRSHSKPSAFVHKYEVIRKSTSKHNTTHSATSIATSHLPKITFNKFIMVV